MAFPLKNLFGKKEEGEALGVGQLVAEPESALAGSGATGSGAFPPGQSPFQQTPPTAAQAQAPASPAANPPAFPDSASVPLHASAKVAPATAVESPFISQPASPAPEPRAEESPFSAAPVAPQAAAAPIEDESPFGAPAGPEAVASPFAAVEASPFSGVSDAAPEAADPEPFATDGAAPDSSAAAPLESPFGAQDSSFASAAPAASGGEISSPFATESPFASMPAASNVSDSALDGGVEVGAPAVTASQSPFALAEDGAVASREAVEAPQVAAPPEAEPKNISEPVEQQAPVESAPVEVEPKAVSPFAALPAIADTAPVEVELPLQLLIKPLGEEVLGFAPEKVPASVMTKVPLDLIKGQLSSGRVALPLGTVIEGCAERFHKAFVRADRDALVTVPIPDLYHHLPEGALAPVAPEPVVEPEPEPEEDLAAIFADEPEPEASLPEPEPKIEAVSTVVASAVEPSITDDFAEFPPVSAGVEEVEAASLEMPALAETSPAEVSGTSPFATPFTEAAANEEVLVEKSEPAQKEEAKPETITPEEPVSVLPPFSPFSEEPLTSDDSASGALSLPSFFDIATPDAEVSETVKAAENEALEPFPEPTAFSDKVEEAPEPEVGPASALPPLGAIIPPVEKPPEEEAFAAAIEEAPKKPLADPMDAFAEDTTLGDIDSMDELPELGDLDDLFPAEDPAGAFESDATAPKSGSLPSAETSPLESVDPVANVDASAREESSTEDVFADTVENKLPEFAPIAPANVFDSATEEPEKAAKAEKPVAEAEPIAPAAVSEIKLPSGDSESEDLSFGIHESEDPHQVALRALFGVEGSIDAERAVDLSVVLPGISACIFTGENSDAIGAGNLDSFAVSGPAVFENVRGLVTAMGIDDAACFTIRTAGGTMSFFSEGDSCLGVLHKEPRFEPGVREKLTIVARELAAIAPALA